MVVKLSMKLSTADQGDNQKKWISFYTSIITIFGIFAALYTLFNLPQDWVGLFAFAAFAAIAELLHVQLYVSSHSYVSVSAIVEIAAVFALGPNAGVFTHLLGGITSTFARLVVPQPSTKDKSNFSLFHRAAFNTSMCMLATLLAGKTYLLMGGVPGSPWQWINVLPVLSSVAVKYFINLSLLIVMIYLQTRRPIKQIWTQDFQWSIPITFVGAVLGGSGLAIGYSVLGIGGLVIFMLPVLATGYSFRLYVQNTRQYIADLEKVNRLLDQSNLELLQSLGSVIDAYDIYTYGHSTQVASYASAIAAEMGLSQEIQDKLLKGGLVHDIGKVGIKDTILTKKERLTDEEYEILKRHTLIGAEIVNQMTGLKELVPIVRNHHERWDGYGYPDHLAGADIPIEARILGLADSVDAMLSDREYRLGRSLADTVREVERCSGTQFDPDVVQAFLNVVDKHGETIFSNSARRVDLVLADKGVQKPVADMRYLKKGMLPTSALFTNIHQR